MRGRRDEVFAAKRCGPFDLGSDHGWEDVAWRRDESENRLVRSGIAAEDSFRLDLPSKARTASKAVGTTAKTTSIAKSDAPQRKSVNARIFRSEEHNCREIKEYDAGKEVIGSGLRLDQCSDTACCTCDCQGLHKARNLRALLACQLADPKQHCGGSQKDERRAQNLLHRAVI